MTPPATANLRDLFTAQAARTPGAVALQSGSAHLTYAELESKASRLAGLLQASGVGSDALVAIHGEPSLDYLVAIVATVLAGGAYLPVDPQLPAQRISFLLDDAQPVVVLSEAARIAEVAGNDRLVLGLEESAWAPLAVDTPTETTASSPEHLAYVMYTSGSTGKPKGVCIPQRGVIRLVRGARYATFGPDTRILQIAPLSFDASTFEIWGSLLNGGTCVSMPYRKPSLQQIEEVLQGSGITTLFLTTALFAEIAERRPTAFRGVKEILTGGETIPPAAVQRVLAFNPGTAVVACYGPTECTTFTTTHRYTAAGQVGETVPLGEPINQTDVHVLRADLRRADIGEEGELYVSGAGLARGYLNRPDLTAQAFLPNPFAEVPGDRLYRSGDRALWNADGELLFRGRRDGQIKLRGFRIELGEIEAALREQEQVSSALVKTEQTLSGDQAIVAYIVPSSTAVAPDPVEDQTVFAERTRQWQQVYSKLLYRSLASADMAGGDPTLNAAGWKSSFDGRPISVDEMEEQVGETVRRIQALAPRRVLEIGCGTGMLLFRLAPHCESYVATDFSADAIDYVRDRVRGVPALHNVQLFQTHAHELPEAPAGGFDVVVLNSVTEHFCSLAYLDELIHAVAGIVSEGGCIFVGDNRSYPVLPLFHASVQLFKSAGTLSVPALAAQTAQALSEEEQMAIDPHYFAQLDARRFRTVSVQLRRGRHHNEMTGYRFDAALVVGQKQTEPVSITPRLWQTEQDSLGAIERTLKYEQPPFATFTHVPNARVAGSAVLLGAVNGNSGLQTVGDLRRAISADTSGQHPEQFWKLGESLGYDVHVMPSPEAADGSFDVVFRRDAHGPFDIRDLASAPASKQLAEMANDPLLAWRKEQVATRARKHLETKLPEYAVPSFFVVLPRFPLNANGKIDAAALPMPQRLQHAGGSGIAQDGTVLERQVRSVWEEILGVRNIGLEERFFEIGGDSLKAVRVASDLSQVLGHDVSPALLFEEPTVRGMAGRLSQKQQAPVANAAPAAAGRAEKRRAAAGLRRQYASA